MHPTHIPLRVATGAFILNSGLGKLKLDEGTAQYLHGAAVSTYPAVFSKMSPQTFGKVLSYSEIGVGAALLAPWVPATAAGAVLTGFGASMLGMYFKNDAMTLEDGIRPSPDGVPVAKDVWMVGGGLTLLSQGVIAGARKRARKVGKTVREAAPFTD